MPCDHKTRTFKICRCCNKWRCGCLIPRERKPHPPFNVSSKLGTKIGLHPKLRAENFDSPAVGSYEPRPIVGKAAARSWKRELESEEFAATMGGKMLDKYIVQRELMRTGRGPGTHEISQWPENVLENVCKSVKKDCGLGTVPLYKSSCPSTTPGPGYVNDPHYHLDRNRFRSFSSVPSFEYDGLQPRFQGVVKSWQLACNRYNVKYPDSLEAFLRKVTGKRGPYDLFTGPRDGSTIKGYMAPPKLEDRGDWPKALPSEIGKLLHKSNYFKGRWTTCPRFTKQPTVRLMLTDISLCYKDPDHPGPDRYQPKSPRKPTSTRCYPFNSNVEFARPVARTEIRPGPGRYRIKEKGLVKGHGWTWAFKSKVPRKTFTAPPSYNSF